MSGIIAQNSGRHTGLVKSASAGGVWNLIETLTASSSATLDFTSGLDSTYDEYVFKYINIHPATDDVFLAVNFSSDTGSNYNVSKTSTYVYTEHGEDDAGGSVNYNGASNRDLANGTGDQYLMSDVGADADQSVSGELSFFGISSTTFVKHFISRNTCAIKNDYNLSTYVSGYANTTSAVDAVQFKMSSGNIDAGQISLFGIS